MTPAEVEEFVWKVMAGTMAGVSIWFVGTLLWQDWRDARAHKKGQNHG